MMSDILAHGVGGRDDLPLPLDLVLQGAAVALLVSFLVLGVAWTKPRFNATTASHPVARPLAFALQGAALLCCALLAIVALAGPDSDENPVPYVVYVLFWVGMPLLSVLVGPVWRLGNPLRLAHRLLCLLPWLPGIDGARPYPRGLGSWPAAVSLAAFTWLELAAPNGSSPRTLAVFFGSYVLLQLVGAVTFGHGWFARADGFEVYSTLLGSLAVVGRRPDGRVGWRNPFEGLAAVRGRPGLAAVVAVCLGSTAFDGFAGTSRWISFVQASPVPGVLLATAGLVVAIGLVAGTYLAATVRAGVAAEIVPSLLPVVVGYLVAHYYSLLVLEGQRAFFLLLGWSDAQPSTALVGPTTVAAVQVGAVLLGHVVGVVAAHDRALGLLPVERRLSGQAPLLLLMVGYTTGGLTLLFAG